MEIFISFYARRSLFTHFVLICVWFVSNFNSKSESHLVSFFTFHVVYAFFVHYFGRAFIQVYDSSTMHVTNGKNFIQIPTQRRRKKSVPISFFSLSLRLYIIYVDICNEIRWRFAFDKLLLRYSLSIFHSIFMVSIIGFDDQIMSNRLLSKLMYRYAHLKLFHAQLRSIRFGIRFD